MKPQSSNVTPPLPMDPYSSANGSGHAAEHERRGDEWGFFDPDQCGVAAVLARVGARPGPAAPAVDAHSDETEQAQARLQRLLHTEDE